MNVPETESSAEQEEAVAPEAEPSAEPAETDVPEAVPTDGPGEAETPEETIEGWLLDAEGAKVQPGTLEKLLSQEGELSVCVSVENKITVKDFALQRLREIRFIADPEVFGGENWRIVLSRTDSLQDEFSEADIAGMQEGDIADLHIWAREEKPAPAPTPVPKPEISLAMESENVFPGEWSCLQPVFTLHGIPDGADNYSYAAVIMDERIAVLSENRYLPQEGICTLRFVLLDEMGDIADRSERCTLYLDFTPPQLAVEISADRDRTMNVYASDDGSGLAGISLDGGRTWQDIADVFSYTAPKKQTFAPGSIQVRDAAGNISENADAVMLENLPKFSYGGGYGGGYGSGSGTPAKQHASGDGETAQYNAYELTVAEGEMTKLILGGEETELMLTDAEGSELAFTAELTGWKKEYPDDSEPGQDTLILHALCTRQDEAPECIWHMNGAVLRKLFNSGVDYLALELDGEMLSLPTIGFAAGTRYAELKMVGTSTAEFNYHVRMRIDPEDETILRPAFNASLRCTAELSVDVAGECFEMLDRIQTPEMYFFDVFCAADDLPLYPYGEYPAFPNEDEEVRIG